MNQLKAGDWVRLTDTIHYVPKASVPCPDVRRFGVTTKRQLIRNTSGICYYQDDKGQEQSICDDHLELALDDEQGEAMAPYNRSWGGWVRSEWGSDQAVRTGWDTAAVRTLITTKKEHTVHKHYRLLQNLPELEAGAILRSDSGAYTPIEPIWDTEAGALNRQKGEDNGQYGTVVEHSPEWFEEIYETSRLGKTVWQTKEAAKAEFAALFTKKK